MKILLTGGTGFLGRRIVSELSGRHALRLLVRRGSSRERFPASVEFAEGDVTDRASLDRALAGCDAVIHAAALVKILAPRARVRPHQRRRPGERPRRGRGGGVRRAHALRLQLHRPRADRRPGARRVGRAARPRPGSTTTSAPRPSPTALARKAIAAGAPLSVVYPGVIYGPGEMTEGNIVVRHILDLVHGRLPGLIGSPDRRWNYVYVDDVARGVALALEAPEPGGRYVLGGENVTLGEFYRLVGQATGAKIPTPALPGRARQDGRRGAEGLGAACAAPPRSSPPTSSRSTSTTGPTARARRRRSSATAARPLAEGLASTVAWLKETGQMGKR